MPVHRIEKIVGGVVVAAAEVAKRGPFAGQFVCLSIGSNMAKVPFATLTDAADFLRTHPGSGIRMNPNWSKIVDGIHIDGLPR
ncbi:hypothetical protein LB534_20305 [Mesorhizobium sp. CA18]|uniref:hypothetical protein n=1 Tax=unclassified Mesorhizobium TaxID=325217 RepID=UPI001CCE9502|nr:MULTISPECIES: hypothetical protein [unclassified Mesorhizobium]MBZ9735763.1 hypothetical protein [Mesorhizobium sp. CA9]MBZ9827636.1 hypothetical protein [Mesorhizobium sp. CA18]MBZ9833338.1 hypothetical protein [Mesorhizobium sp. CA2]MBZ9839651.1 hypothetical protein [Mesorhizobium sp. CA3]MBZ9879854.1 hypothetical protein [Mesorhizobium sp. Ca11]